MCFSRGTKQISDCSVISILATKSESSHKNREQLMKIDNGLHRPASLPHKKYRIRICDLLINIMYNGSNCRYYEALAVRKRYNFRYVGLNMADMEKVHGDYSNAVF